MKMPKIDLETLERKLTPGRFAIVKGIVATRGENKGCLRASKPKLARMTRYDDDSDWGYHYDYATEEERQQAYTAYVWRMVAFFVSPVRQHRCMPVMCDCELPGRGEERRKLAKTLDDAIVSVVIDSIPLKEQYGTLAWGRAFGMI